MTLTDGEVTLDNLLAHLTIAIFDFYSLLAVTGVHGSNVAVTRQSSLDNATGPSVGERVNVILNRGSENSVVDWALIV